MQLTSLLTPLVLSSLFVLQVASLPVKVESTTTVIPTDAEAPEPTLAAIIRKNAHYPSEDVSTENEDLRRNVHYPGEEATDGVHLRRNVHYKENEDGTATVAGIHFRRNVHYEEEAPAAEVSPPKSGRVAQPGIHF